MDTLIAVGGLAGYVYSIYLLTSAQHGYYFESTGLVLMFVNLGKYVEKRTTSKTKNALEAIAKLAPNTVSIKRRNEIFIIDRSFVVPGDLIVVKPGEAIGVDGIVVEGNGLVDESMLTGESNPVERGVEAEVHAWTVNLSAVLIVKTTCVGNDTMLSKIVKLMMDTLSSKTTISRIVDQVCHWFVPVVIGLAIATEIIWFIVEPKYAVNNMMAVLVIACPCALGLATPIAIMVASLRGAKAGIIIKNGTILETLMKLDVVVFDKTGTLTKGILTVRDIIIHEKSYDELSILAIVSGIERYSEHPIGKAIVNRAQELSISPVNLNGIVSLPGSSMRCESEYGKILMAKANY